MSTLSSCSTSAASNDSPTVEDQPAVLDDDLLNSILDAAHDVKQEALEADEPMSSTADPRRIHVKTMKVRLSGVKIPEDKVGHLIAANKLLTHKCKLCPKAFSNGGKLNAHMNIHTKRISYTCQFCQRVFYHRYNLERHENIHKGVKFDCFACEKTFSMLQTLSEHVKKCHNGEKPFRCDKCSKEFLVERQLETHVCTLKAAKQLECNWCDRTFNESRVFYNHLARHHPDEKTFCCPRCPHRFRMKQELNAHIRDFHHDDEPRTESTPDGSEDHSESPPSMDHSYALPEASSMMDVVGEEQEDIIVLQDDEESNDQPANEEEMEVEEEPSTLQNSIDSAADELAIFLSQYATQQQQQQKTPAAAPVQVSTPAHMAPPAPPRPHFIARTPLVLYSAQKLTPISPPSAFGPLRLMAPRPTPPMTSDFFVQPAMKSPPISGPSHVRPPMASGPSHMKPPITSGPVPATPSVDARNKFAAKMTERANWISVKYKRPDGKCIVVKGQRDGMTYGSFLALFGIPRGTGKRFIFKSKDEGGEGGDEWTMVAEEHVKLPVVNGFICAEVMES